MEVHVGWEGCVHGVVCVWCSCDACVVWNVCGRWGLCVVYVECVCVVCQGYNLSSSICSPPMVIPESPSTKSGVWELLVWRISKVVPVLTLDDLIITNHMATKCYLRKCQNKLKPMSGERRWTSGTFELIKLVACLRSQEQKTEPLFILIHF